MKNLLVVGRGRSGKDMALDYLGAITTLRNAGTTSAYLAPYVAARQGLSVPEAYAVRHRHRELWKRTGDEVREQRGDPACFVRDALAAGEMTGGVRDLEEIIAARDLPNLLIVWVENRRAPLDPTLTFGSRHADVIVENHDRRRDFYEKLWRHAAWAGLPMRETHA